MIDIYAKDWRELRIAAFDTETTGIDVKNDRIVEIGIVIFEGGKPIKKYCKLINPGKKKMKPQATKACGITDDDLKGKKPFVDRAKKIKSLLGKEVDLILAFNDQFDRSLLIEEFKRAGISYEDTKPCIDLMIWSRDLWPTSSNKLDDVIQRLRIPINRKDLKELKINRVRHRADYDAYVTAVALYAMQMIMPKTLRQTLYVQDFIYMKWLINIHQNNPKYARYLNLTMPPEHRS